MTLIEGDGFAARACVKLLHDAGQDVAQSPADRLPSIPAIVIPVSTAALIRDVLGIDLSTFAAHTVAFRQVRWGGADGILVPHQAVVVTAESLTASLPQGESPVQEPEWQIQCRGSGGQMRCFGSRRASYVRVRFAASARRDCCMVESLPDGWLFLIPGALNAWVIAVGDQPEALLRQSVLLRPQLAEWGEQSPGVPSHPQLAWPLAVGKLLHAGPSAARFDPLCGDGTGHAVREAILAAAIVKSAKRGETSEHLAMHYAYRILGGFRRHLEACLMFYENGGDGSWWRTQSRALREGLAFCDEQLREARFGYRLSGLELEPIR